MQTQIQTQTLRPGDKVLFGRSHGEQTLGTVLKVNPKSVMVQQDEARGTMRAYPVGTKWKVAPSFVRKVEGGSVAAPVMAPEVMARLKARQDADFAALTGRTTVRPEATIMQEILRCYAGLSPENLTCDGELRGPAVARRAAALRSRLRALFVELGRKVSESEAYGFVR